MAVADDLVPGQKVPPVSEAAAVGAATSKIRRGTTEFAALVRNSNVEIIFKDEEGTGADRMMSMRLNEACNALAALVSAEWPGRKLRVTEAWDEDGEHAGNSLHYEARAADLTVSDSSLSKLGRLGRLTVDAGFGWVCHERNHIHASVAKDAELVHPDSQ